MVGGGGANRAGLLGPKKRGLIGPKGQQTKLGDLLFVLGLLMYLLFFFGF